MSVQSKKFFDTRFLAGGALMVSGALLLGDRLFADTMTNWAYAEIFGPIILTAVGALTIFRAFGRRGESDRRDELGLRDERANLGHYAA